LSNKWRDVTPYEFYPYNNLIKKQIASVMDKYEQHASWGSLISGKFRVHYKIASTSGKLDRRKRTGGTCANKRIPDLMDLILLENRVTPSVAEISTSGLTRNQMITYLVQQKFKTSASELSVAKYSLSQIRLAYKWYMSPKRKVADMCNFLQEIYFETGRLLDPSLKLAVA
jgi:hypothetical protein